MSEPKFTPGEWKFGVRPDGSMWLSLGDPAKGPHYQGDLVASIDDARLIVNARELYEALVAMTVTFASPEYMIEARQKTRTALARVRGAA